MSDYDSENYSSEEDSDYMPSDEEYSEDDVSELVKEDDLDGDGEENVQKEKGKPKSSKGIPARKRKKRGLLLEGEKQSELKKESPSKEEEEEGAAATEQFKQVKAEEEEKKAADNLWASFLSDVGHRPSLSATAGTTSAASQESSRKEQERVKDSEKSKETAKVTITKVFDFAGEEVRVTKEVDASSKEAKNFFKQQERDQEDQLSSSLPASETAKPAGATLTVPAGPGAKRPGGLSNILGKIGGKKQKMSTLEKSKLDWESFKEQEGIGEELAIHNRGKDGYIERKAFLERVDHRQFEIERSIRLSNMKR
ncbi:craniofacial development protein 1 [Latimeria chalumnae]|uniref:Craniofacial development protein 1 n=1 Tax=Latimeria chalumnae TaxID=7897 RepID=H3AMY4_LATCH|nr:PREDICTED: craniofacial development protein 1 [Latimeria chalumnae]|eukprot:XP_014347750.1 PREDICTED: craniofacial development protein 1 [Latimeria chalumnae]